MTTGKFIVIDGIEGAGKSTQIKFIAEYFQAKKREVVLTREPGGTPLGEKLRDILLNTEIDILPTSELLLMFAARHQHLHEKIIPNINAGKIIISDRFVDSSYAYQGGGRGLETEIIDSLSFITLENFKPDLTIFLNLPLEMALERIKQRETTDRIEKESLEFFTKTYNAYQQRLKDDPTIKNIDSSGEITATQQQIINLLQKL
jgi:dTMP kinase